MAAELTPNYRALCCLAMSQITVNLAACNMPTQPSNIRATGLSINKYEATNCSELSKIIETLVSEENTLVTSQNRRINDSQGHAVYYGWGKGDGMDTVELAKARAQLKSAKAEFAKKDCEITKGEVK